MKKAVIVFIFLFAGVNIIHAYRLNLNLVEGQTYYHNSRSRIVMEHLYYGEKINYEMTMTSKSSYYVRERRDDYYILEARIIFVEMQIGSSDNALIFGSNVDDPKDVFSRIIKKMIKQKLEIKIRRNGRIDEINNIDEMYSAAFDAMPELSKKKRKEIITLLESTFGEKVFIGNMEILTAIFPLGDVQLNDSWENKIGFDGDKYLAIDNLFTLKECYNDYAFIRGIAHVISRDNKEYKNVSGYKVKYNLTGTMTSNLRIDKLTGWIVDSEISQSFEGTATMRRNFLFSKITIPTKMKVYTKITDNMTRKPTFLEAGISDDYIYVSVSSAIARDSIPR